jgi:uncharacterized protein
VEVMRMEYKNSAIIDKFFESYSKRDLKGINQVLDENAVWIFPGQNPLSGAKIGPSEIISFFDKMGALMSKSNIKVEKLITGGNIS